MAKWVKEAFPEEEPHWDYNTEEGRHNLERYQQIFLQGAKTGAKRPANLAKILRYYKNWMNAWLTSIRDCVKLFRSIPLLISRSPETNG